MSYISTRNIRPMHKDYLWSGKGGGGSWGWHHELSQRVMPTIVELLVLDNNELNKVDKDWFEFSVLTWVK